MFRNAAVPECCLSVAGWLSTAVILTGLCAVAAWTQGRRPPSPSFQAWVAYFRGPEGLQILQQIGESLQEISVFALQFDGEGRVVPASPWVVQTLNKLGTRPEGSSRLWVTVVNDVRSGKQALLKDARIVHDLIAAPDKRVQHIEDLVSRIGPAQGLDIDYEGLNKEDGEAFSLFIEELAPKVHALGKRLSVTVGAKTTIQPGNGSRAIDWARVGAAADQVRIMGYYLHSPRGRPGPIATLSWLSEITKLAQTWIPAEKLAVILAVNGVDWRGPGQGRGISFAEADALRVKHQATSERDPASQTLHFRYGAGEDTHDVWYEDAVSLQAKVDRLRREGVQRVGFWQLGSGDPAFWTWLKTPN